MKKSILGLGSAVAIVAPIVGVVACDSDSTTKEKSLKEILTSKVIVLNSVDAAKTDQGLLTAIKAQINKDFASELKKADMLTVNADKSNSKTASAIVKTKDEEAIKFYVTVERDGKEVVDAKNIEIKVRKETIEESNQRKFDAASKLIEDYSKSASALELDLSDFENTSYATGVTKAAYTSAELSGFIGFALNAHTAGIVATSDAEGSASILVKEVGGVAATTGTTDNTVDLSTAKKVKIELKFGEIKKDIELYVKTVV